ncbi:HAD hydrolase-like protein [Deinococcus peraridilitoris]|uniref:Putative phosphatase n=1 Tax=Deinococcus peraridilitoris (strain DSM 19664 / LMG 22246 / CIP 109416 / KR-200) TaxID=937777 RepID=L0A9L5_DEIPD|nr:HAD hydrolase-like protein [Deinococcus peraridilitoris]AFZ69570.1 putative phosphatase [Deinococcus peraridilitoris DSM 19664]AFZ69745.1 putative phosphatase [Deinococcus peraridilitoris DSM 19664]
MISHVVFDFDGTLADSPHLVVELYNEVARKQGFGEMTPENLHLLRGLSVRERSKQLGVPMHRLPGLMVQVARAYRAVTSRVALHDGVPELLRELRGRGMRVCVLSTNNEENIRDVLRRYDLEAMVSRVYCSNRIFGKASLLRRLMHHESVPADQLVYVGDEQRDVDACREVGVQVIAVSWGVDTLTRLQDARPDWLVHTPEGISRVVATPHKAMV